MNAPSSVLSDLAAALPSDRIVTDPETLRTHASDSGNAIPAGTPLALVFAESTEEVQIVLRAAMATGTPVVPQGSRTGVVGGANAIDGCILLSLSRMDRILSIDEKDQLAVVQPGVIGNALREAAAARGLFYPPDPGSVYLSSLGGNIATNAGGMCCVKYGTTKQFVRSLDVVLADGTLIQVGHDTVKGVAGLDLADLFVGSEGTLGVVTEATMALLPAPGEVHGASGAFATMEDALRASQEIMASPYSPSALELMDGEIVRAIRRFDPSVPLPDNAEAILLVQSDEQDRAAADVAYYSGVFERNGAIETATAHSPEEVTALMDARRLLHPALLAQWGMVMSEDIAVTRSKLIDLLHGIEEAQRATGAPIATGGHVGDGNLHPIIGFDDTEGSHERAVRAFELIMRTAAELGGTITGEHGVGILKKEAVSAELSADVLSAQRLIKGALDPRGILNPGKKY